jgi:PilZ domain
MVTSAEGLTAAGNNTAERRFYPRVVPSDAIYIGPDGKNQGMLLNLSENGLLVSTPIPLKVNFVSRIAVPVGGLSNAINGYARVVWADESTNRVGIQLLELSEQDRLALRQWIEVEFARSSREAERSFPDAEMIAAPLGAELTVENTKNMNAIAPAAAAAPPAHVVRKRPVSLMEVAVWGFLIGSLSVAAVMFGGNVTSRGVSGGEAGNAASVAEVKEGSPANAPQRPQIAANLPARTRSEHSASDSGAAPVSDELVGSEQRSDSASSTVSENLGRDADASPAATALRTLSESNARVRAERTRNTAAENTFYTAKHPSSKQDSQMSSAAELPASTAALVAPEKDAVGSNAANPVGNLSGAKYKATAPSDANSSATNSAAKSAAKPSNNAPEAYPVPAKIISTDINPAARANVMGARSTTIGPNGTSNGARTFGLPVVQMNPPERATMEVRAPAGFRSATLALPNSRLVESPGLTMHIERSLMLPGGHKLWPFDRKRTVAVGELVSRVDPQSPYAQTGSGVSVRVKAMVARDGHVARLELISGPAVVVPDVMRALREWQYQPTLVDGRPVETQSDILMQFHSAERAAR